MTSRPSTAAPILAVLAVVLVTLGAYAGGYFWLGEWEEDPFANEGDGFRSYKSRWIAWSFMPAAKVESLLSGHDIQAAWWPEDFE